MIQKIKEMKSLSSLYIYKVEITGQFRPGFLSAQQLLQHCLAAVSYFSQMADVNASALIAFIQLGRIFFANSKVY